MIPVRVARSRRYLLACCFLVMLSAGVGCKRRPVTVIPQKIFVPPPPEPREPAPAPELPPPSVEAIARSLTPTVPPDPPEAIRQPAPVPPFREPVRGAGAGTPARRPPALQLGALLSPEEEQRYRDKLEADLARIRRNLARLARRSLTERQAAELRRVRALVEQAEAMRGRDLAAASELAGRAVILSEELLRTSR